MAAVSETIVREYFEMHGFFVRQHRKFVAPAKPDDDADFYVMNPRPVAETSPLPFLLASADLRRLSRAVVVVKAWHSETFSPAFLVSEPKLFRFVEASDFQAAAKNFGADGPLTKVLVVPSLPVDRKAREESVAMLRSKGVDAIISFHTMLDDLIDHVEPNRNYQKSDVLQVIRILKNYDFFRERQLELFKPGRKTSIKAEVSRGSRPRRKAGANPDPAVAQPAEKPSGPAAG
jgi:hypothetical protein